MSQLKCVLHKVPPIYQTEIIEENEVDLIPGVSEHIESESTNEIFDSSDLLHMHSLQCSMSVKYKSDGGEWAAVRAKNT